MADPFTIRIFVPGGDPEGLRIIIDRMNWTGQGIVSRARIGRRSNTVEIFQKPVSTS